LGIALAVSAVFSIAACDRIMGRTEQDYLRKAKELQEQGEFQSAVIQFRNALQKNPKNSEARLRLAEVYVALGQGPQAEKDLQQAKELNVDSELLKVPLGQALLLQGLYPRVIAEVQLSPKTPPENVPKILELQARAQLGLLHLDEGCKLFAESIEKNSRYVPGYRGLARCAAAQGRLEEARIYLDKALKIDDKDSGTWLMMGDLDRAEKHYAEADTAYENALKYKPGNLDALLSRAAGRIDSGRLAEARADIDAAAKQSSDNPLVVQLRGVVQYKQGKFSDAETSFQNVLKRQPDFLPATLWLGLANLAEGHYEQAVRQFSQYTGKVRSLRVQALLGLAQAKLGQSEDAEKTLSVLRNVDVKDPQSLAVLAEAHAALGENDLAAAYLSRAVQQKPEAADLRIGLAATLSARGERGQAIEQLETATHLDPGMVDADVLLIKALIQQKEYDRALDAVAALEKKQPGNPATSILKGAAYLGKKDPAAARKSFEQALSTGSTAAAMNLAQLDLAENKSDAARERFQALLAKDKTDAQAMMGMAGVAAATKQESEYVEWLEKAAKAAPSAPRPRSLLAAYYLKKGDLRNAVASAQDAVNANPDDAQALDVLGSAQLAAGDKENAVVSFSKVVKLVPRNPLARYQLATAQIATQNVAGAKLSLQKALALKADYLEAEILLASAEMHAGNHANALKIAQTVQKQYPKSAQGLVLQGDVLMAQKQFGPAQKAYEKAQAMNDSPVVAIKLHQALAASGNAKEADPRLVRWLKDHPSDVAARVYLAGIYLKADQTKQAVEQYELVLKNDPSNVRALNDLAWLYQQEKDQRALATAERAYQLVPNNPEIMDTLGWILVQHGETVRGRDLLKKAVDAAPSSLEIRYHWAAALAQSGDKPGARAELQDLLRQDKNFAQRQEAQALLRGL